MNQGKDAIKQLADKLQKDFNISLENYNLTSDCNPPVFLLKFPTNLTTSLQLMFSTNTSEIMENILIKSAHFTKMGRFVRPDAPLPTANIESFNPFIINFQGLTPFAFFFAKTIMDETQNNKDIPKY